MPTPVFKDGYIYGVDSYGELRCLKADTGERVWTALGVTQAAQGRQPRRVETDRDDRWDNAFLIPQGDRCFLFNETGELIIAKLDAERLHRDRPRQDHRARQRACPAGRSSGRIPRTPTSAMLRPQRSRDRVRVAGEMSDGAVKLAVSSLRPPLHYSSPCFFSRLTSVLRAMPSSRAASALLPSAAARRPHQRLRARGGRARPARPARPSRSPSTEAVVRRAGAGRRSAACRTSARQVVDRHHRPVGDDHGPLDDVFQLADVARPVVRLAAPAAPRRRSARPPCRPAAPYSFRKCCGQLGDVLRPLAQRRHGDRDDVEPIEQVLAEPALAGSAASRSWCVAATMRTSTCIGSLEPTRSKVISCSTRSSLVCTSRLMSPISSRNSVPPSASSKRPTLSRSAPGERPLDVAEQLALQQARRQGGAVDLDERLARPRAVLVDRLGQQLLAGAALAADQHGRRAGRHLADQAQAAAATAGLAPTMPPGQRRRPAPRAGFGSTRRWRRIFACVVSCSAGPGCAAAARRSSRPWSAGRG